MKKILANILALVACFSTFALTACDNEEDNGGSVSIGDVNSNQEESSQESAESMEQNSGNDAENSVGSSNSAETSTDGANSTENNDSAEEGGQEKIYTVTAAEWKTILSAPKVDNLQMTEYMSYQGRTGIVNSYVDGVKWHVITTMNDAWSREEYYDLSQTPLIYQRESENGGYTTFVPNEEQLNRFEESYTLRWIEIISAIKDSYQQAVYDAESKSYTVPLNFDTVYTSCQVFFENAQLVKWNASGTFEGGRVTKSTFYFGGVSVTLPMLS